MPICDLNPGNTAVLFFIISGVTGTFAYKLMGCQQVSQGGHDRSFYHPYMEAMTMSIGEVICLIIYYSKLQKYKLPLESGKTPHRFYYFLIPGFWDITLSIMQYLALSFISGSTFKILQGGAIVTSLIFSRIMIKMAIEKRHLIGCSLAIIGLTIIGLSSFINSSSTSQTEVGLQILGIGVMLLSLVFEGYKYVYQQRLMARHTIHQYELVGWQGFFGIIIILIISLLFSIIPCSFTEQLCVYDTYGNPYLERFDVFFVETFTSWPLAILVIVGTLSSTVSNASGMAITKYFDGLTRCLMSISKTSFVWIIGMIITFSVGDDPHYQLQSQSVGINLIKAVGFAFIILGTLIYNKLIFTSCLSKQSEEIEAEEQKDMKDQLLQATSQQSSKL